MQTPHWDEDVFPSGRQNLIEILTDLDIDPVSKELSAKIMASLYVLHSTEPSDLTPEVLEPLYQVAKQVSFIVDQELFRRNP